MKKIVYLCVSGIFLASIILSSCSKQLSNVEFGNLHGILHIGNGTEPKDLDPHIVTGVPEHNIISSLLEGLVSEHPKTLEPTPAVALSWEISEDQKKYTFNLRENALWSDGDTITAEDFIYSWKRILSPALASEYAYMLHCIKNAEAFNKGKITSFGEVGINSNGRLVLEIELKAPTPYFLSMLSHFSFFPVQKKCIRKFGKDDEQGTKWTRPGNFIGNGPFLLKVWDLNRMITVEKNPLYWDAKNVKLNAINFHPIDNIGAEERMFRAKQLHITSGLPTEKIAVYKKEYPKLLRIDPYLGTYYYRLNTKVKPLDDIKVRRALALSMDRSILVDRVTKGGQLAAFAFTPPETRGYTPPKLINESFDEAKKLLAEAGYPEGEGFPPLEILYNTSEGHRKLAVAIQQMWKKTLNIDVILVNQDWKVYLSNVKNGDYMIARAGWIGDYADPSTFLNMFVSNGGNNQTGWSNSQYDALIDATENSGVDSIRFAQFNEAEILLMEEMPIIPVYVYTSISCVSESVKGWQSNVLNHHPYKYVELVDDKN